MDELAALSEITTNRAKSMVIEMDPRGSDLPIEMHVLTLLSPSSYGRYLGVMVGQQDASTENWTKYIRKLWCRLVEAIEKTHTVEQRSRLASAIAVPKITFLARHGWPSLVSRLYPGPCVEYP